VSSVETNFHIVGFGSADLEFKFTDRHFVAEGISYTTDAVGDLLRAALLIAAGAPNASVSFDREPAEWRLILRSLLDVASGRGPVELSVFEFADSCAALPDSEGHEVFKVSCSALDFAHAVLKTVDSVKGAASAMEFGGDFEVAYQALKAALNVYADRAGTPLSS